MADISKIKLPDGTTYTIKDTVSGYGYGTITGVSVNGTPIATSGVADIPIAPSSITANVQNHTLNITTNIPSGDGVSY